MEKLIFDVANSTWKWSGSCEINYDTVYDAETNRTTVTFRESAFVYFGRNGYGTSATAAITVTAADNAGSSGAATLSTYGTTDGGSKSYPGTPSPTTVTVQHGDEDGTKSVIVSATATVKAYMTSYATSQTEGTGSGSKTTQSGTRESTTARIMINGAAVKATPYVGRKKAKAYHGRVKM